VRRLWVRLGSGRTARRPVRYADELPAQIEGLIVGLKGDRPLWGASQIRELPVRRLDGDVRVPAKSTIHAVLHRHGLVKPIGRAPSRHPNAALDGLRAQRALAR
jgi:hypothetical protein